MICFTDWDLGLVEVEHGLYLQTSHLVIHGSAHFLPSTVALKPYAAPGSPWKTGRFSRSPWNPDSEAQIGHRAWEFPQRPRRVFPWASDHTWENPIWNHLLPSLVGTDFLRHWLLGVLPYCFVLTDLWC